MKATKTVEQIGTSRKNRLDSDIQARGFFGQMGEPPLGPWVFRRRSDIAFGVA